MDNGKINLKVAFAFLSLTIFAGAAAGIFAAGHMQYSVMIFASQHFDVVFFLTVFISLILGFSGGGLLAGSATENLPLSSSQVTPILSISYGICILFNAGLWGLVPRIQEAKIDTNSLLLTIIQILGIKPISFMIDISNLSKLTGIFGAIGGVFVGLFYYAGFKYNFKREVEKITKKGDIPLNHRQIDGDPTIAIFKLAREQINDSEKLSSFDLNKRETNYVLGKIRERNYKLAYCLRTYWYHVLPKGIDFPDMAHSKIIKQDIQNRAHGLDIPDSHLEYLIGFVDLQVEGRVPYYAPP